MAKACLTLQIVFVTMGVVTLNANTPNTGMADPSAMINAFKDYLSKHGGERYLKIPLTTLRGITSENFNAGGNVLIDLVQGSVDSLRANIDETILPVIISEQGENRDQCEEQRNSFGFSHGFACR